MRTALITGASVGIGRELARVFAGDGWNVAIVARGERSLRELADELRGRGATVHVYPLDLARDGAAQELFAATARDGLHVDALVNNAGVSTHGKFIDVSADADLGQIHLNVITLTHLCKLFLAPMIERRSGYVLNVASTAAFQAGPLMSVYYATKAYVLSLTEALAEETRGTGVRVSALCPGATETGFAERANMPRTRLFALAGPDAAAVARAGYEAMLAGRTVMIPGWRNRVFAFALRLSPRWLVTLIVRHLNTPA